MFNKTTPAMTPPSIQDRMARDTTMAMINTCGRCQQVALHQLRSMGYPTSIIALATCLSKILKGWTPAPSSSSLRPYSSRRLAASAVVSPTPASYDSSWMMISRSKALATFGNGLFDCQKHVRPRSRLSVTWRQQQCQGTVISEREVLNCDSS